MPRPSSVASSWASLREWYVRNGRHDLPWRDLDSPWKVLVAEVLLHRTRAATVAALFPRITEEFHQPLQVIQYEAQWLKMTQSLGLFWRAKTFVETCRALVEQHDGSVPVNEEKLLKLPGVGPYIAAAVRCFGFGFAAAIVDTNTLRLAGRLAGRSMDEIRRRSTSVRQLVDRLGEGELPPLPHDNYAVLDLIGLICLPRSPRCSQCPLVEDCMTGGRLTHVSQTTTD